MFVLSERNRARIYIGKNRIGVGWIALIVTFKVFNYIFKYIFMIYTLIFRNRWTLLPSKIWYVSGQKKKKRRGRELTCILKNYILKCIFNTFIAIEQSKESSIDRSQKKISELNRNFKFSHRFRLQQTRIYLEKI